MTNSVNMDRRRAKSYEEQKNNYHINLDSETTLLQFRPNHPHQAMESVNSGETSPPLWKNINNSPSPPKSPSYPLLGHHGPPSPDPRAQAIARGQWELMEMVKNMPESSYELSLKDLVENRETIIDENRDDDHSDQRDAVRLRRSPKEGKKVNYERNKGLVLNMVFPFGLMSGKKKKKKKKLDNNNNNKFGGGNNKVSPKVDERDWWKKKRFTGSSDSDSSRISSNSGGGGDSSTITTVSSGGGSRSSGGGGDSGRKRNGTGCWPFFCPQRGKSEE